MDEQKGHRGILWGTNRKVADYHIERFEEFVAQPSETIRAICTDEQGRLKHVARAEHFDLDFVTTICETAHAARKLGKLPGNTFLSSLLPYKAALNFFKQPSSRTLTSFFRAEGILGMDRFNVQDITTSSQFKGESDADSLRTASSYADVVVARHPSVDFDLFGVYVATMCGRDFRYVNAGSGPGEHPTQGLLDAYTISESFTGELDGRSIAFVGDCLRGRTVHSLAKILSLYECTEIYFVAPEELQIDQETEDYVTERGVTIHKITDGLRDIAPLVDVVYMTRIQNEHGGGGEYDPRFIFDQDTLDSMKEEAIEMHPLPKREEISPDLDYSKDPRLMHWREMRNGMWTRVAIMSYLFGVDDRIRQEYDRLENVIR
tara:strand:- start:284 stop:1411 length:1128 start_codon:yes stop_codon:yes gene_type:complete